MEYIIPQNEKQILNRGLLEIVCEVISSVTTNVRAKLFTVYLQQHADTASEYFGEWVRWLRRLVSEYVVLLYEITILSRTKRVFVANVFKSVNHCPRMRNSANRNKIRSQCVSYTVSSFYLTTHNLPSYCNLFLSNYTIITEVMRQ